MSIVIRGLNVAWKFVTRGFSSDTVDSRYVKISRVFDSPFINQKVSDNPFISVTIKSEN